MNAIERKIHVLDRRYIAPIAYKEGTNAIPIKLTLVDYEIPAGAAAKVYVAKPSGDATYNTATISGNSVTVEPSTDMFSESGKNNLFCHITKDSDVLFTFNVPVNVEKNPIANGGGSEGSNSPDIIQRLINRVADLEDGGVGSGVPDGGTAGQVLTKQSATDGDATWSDPDVSAQEVADLKSDLKETNENLEKMPFMRQISDMDGFLIIDKEYNIGVQFGSLKYWDEAPYNKKYGFGGHPYGNGVLPPFSRVSGIFESDMMSVRGGKGRWNNSDTGNFDHGGHLFEGWNAEEDVRLTAGIGLTNKNIAWIQTFHPATEEGTDNNAYYAITKIGSDLDGEGCNFLPKVCQIQSTFVLWQRPQEYAPSIPDEQLDMLVDTKEVAESVVRRNDNMILGAMYYDTTLDRVRVYTKQGWKSLKFEEE